MFQPKGMEGSNQSEWSLPAKGKWNVPTKGCGVFQPKRTECSSQREWSVPASERPGNGVVQPKGMECSSQREWSIPATEREWSVPAKENNYHRLKLTTRREQQQKVWQTIGSRLDPSPSTRQEWHKAPCGVPDVFFCTSTNTDRSK